MEWRWYSREVVKVFHWHPRPSHHSVHLIVKAIQQEAQKLLSILLTVVRERERENERD